MHPKISDSTSPIREEHDHDYVSLTMLLSNARLLIPNLVPWIRQMK